MWEWECYIIVILTYPKGSNSIPIQGKYVPPERTDGLLPEEKRVLEEEKEEGAKEEEEKEETETNSPAPAADIDLDWEGTSDCLLSWKWNCKLAEQESSTGGRSSWILVQKQEIVPSIGFPPGSKTFTWFLVKNLEFWKGHLWMDQFLVKGVNI